MIANQLEIGLLKAQVKDQARIIAEQAEVIAGMYGALNPFAELAQLYEGHTDDGAVLIGLREVFAAAAALALVEQRK